MNQEKNNKKKYKTKHIVIKKNEDKIRYKNKSKSNPK